LTAAVVRLIERTRRQHGNVIDYPSNAASRTSP
jgi:ribosomal protein L14